MNVVSTLSTMTTIGKAQQKNGKGLIVEQRQASQRELKERVTGHMVSQNAFAIAQCEEIVGINQ